MLFLVFGNLRMKLFDFFENSMGTIAATRKRTGQELSLPGLQT